MTVKSAGRSAEQVPPGALAHEHARLACRDAGIEVHEAHTAQECREVVDLLNDIWGATEVDIIDVAFMIALAHSGNLVAVASRGGEPLGAAVGFSGPPGTAFHSHIVGVVPEAAGQGVGRAIKLRQRAWCLDRGVDRMTWTYDPLVARNGYFNLRRLGAFPEAYHRDFYGTMSDAINAGQLTDRMLVGWDLTTARPSGPGSGTPEAAVGEDGPGVHVALANDDDRPGTFTLPPDDPGVLALIGVPRDIEAIRREDPELARRWREGTREAFTDLMGRGWAIRDFTRSCHYVLHLERTP